MEYEWLDKNNEYWKNTEEIYNKAKNEGDWETIFKCVHRYCTAYVVKFLSKKYVIRHDLPDIALDATTMIVDRIKRLGFPKNLKNYCYKPTQENCFGIKRIAEDSTFAYSYDEYVENNQIAYYDDLYTGDEDWECYDEDLRELVLF